MRLSSTHFVSPARLSPADASGSAGIRRRLAVRGVALAMTAALAPAAATVVAAPAAQAHSSLIATTPEQGATLAEAPESVEIEFNEEISPDFASLTVMSDGEDVAEGDPEVDGASISVDVPSLEAGTYTVGYRVVSADGHPVQGSWEFTVEGAGGSGASAAESTAAEAGAAEATSGDSAGPSNDQSANPAESDDSTQAADEADDDGINIAAAIGLLAVLAIALIGGAAFLLQRHKRNMAQFHQNDQ